MGECQPEQLVADLNTQRGAGGLLQVSRLVGWLADGLIDGLGSVVECLGLPSAGLQC